MNKNKVTARDALTTLAHFLAAVYEQVPRKERGSIQLELRHQGEVIPCYFTADGKKLDFQFGTREASEAGLKATLYDWLALAGGKLGPVWGSLRGRLKFRGDLKLFDRLFKQADAFRVEKPVHDPPLSFERNPVRHWQKPSRVLVLNASPRGNAGYTYRYLEPFIEGLKAGCDSVEVVELARHKVNPCRGCFQCWKKNTGRCIQQDDGNALYEIFQAADLIIYAFPLYWDTVPALLKNMIERAFCLEYPYIISGTHKMRHPRRDKRNQSFFAFSVCGFPEKTHFSAVQHYFRALSHNTHLPYLGGIYRTACMFLANSPFYFEAYNRVLAGCREAGQSLVIRGKVAPGELKRIHCRIDHRQFRRQTNKFWENVLAGDEFCVRKI